MTFVTNAEIKPIWQRTSLCKDVLIVLGASLLIGLFAKVAIPLPFTPAIVLKAAPIWVPAEASEEEVRQLHHQMQQILDDLRRKGDSWW